MGGLRTLRSVLIVAAVGLALSGVADGVSQASAQQAFTRALVTFAAARTLNSVISAAQGTEVALEPGGVGVILSIGEALDPINDLVERFSSVMLVAASSLGLQNILLDVAGWWGMTAALAIAGFAALTALWWPSSGFDRGRSLLYRGFLVMLFLRFAVPLLVLTTNLLSDMFLSSELEASAAALEATQTEIEAIGDEDAAPPVTDPSLLERMRTMLDDGLQSLNATERLERLRETASSAAEHIVNLIVIFVLQTILLPIGIFWLLLEIARGWVSRMAKPGG